MEKAGQPEIVRSHQKDQFFVERFGNEISKIVLESLGPRWWMKLRKEVTLLSDLGYYFLTIGSGFQTLGEEYCNIIQVDDSNSRIPSRRKRHLMILLDCIGPYLCEKVISSLQRSIEHSNQIRPDRREQYHKLLDLLKQLISSLSRLHLAYFYFQGFFYALSQRVLGIRYVLIRRFLKDSSSSPGYKFLSYMLAFQFAITSPWLLFQITKGLASMVIGMKSDLLKRNQKGTDDKLDIQVAQATKKNMPKCPLCLECIVQMAATPCGHVFCWDCIISWANEKTECPVCRDEIAPSRVTLLKHFKPVGS